MNTDFFKILFICLLFILSMATEASPKYKRIIGGTHTPDNAYPEIARYVNKWILRGKTYTYTCSAVLIRNRKLSSNRIWLLTAGHCINSGYIPHTVSFLNYVNPDQEFKNLPVHRAIRNPDFHTYEDDGREYYSGDYGLLEVEKPNEFSLIPMELDYTRITEKDIVNGLYTEAIVAGYGLDNDYDSGVLNHATLPFLPSSNCWGNDILKFVADHEFCLGGFNNGGAGVYFGDSGGPVFRIIEGQKWINGLISASGSGVNIIDPEPETNNLPVRNFYRISYAARIDGAKDFIISHTGINNNQRFGWSSDFHGTARLTENRQGLCIRAQDELCVFNIDKTECQCFSGLESDGSTDSSNSGGIELYSREHFLGYHEFEFLVGTLEDDYHWQLWQPDFPESVVFDSTRTGLQEGSGFLVSGSNSGSGGIEKPLIPCRVVLAAGSSIGLMQNNACYFMSNNSGLAKMTVFDVLVSNLFVPSSSMSTPSSTSALMLSPSITALVTSVSEKILLSTNIKPSLSTNIEPSLSTNVEPSVTMTLTSLADKGITKEGISETNKSLLGVGSAAIILSAVTVAIVIPIVIFVIKHKKAASTPDAFLLDTIPH